MATVKTITRVVAGGAAAGAAAVAGVPTDAQAQDLSGLSPGQQSLLDLLDGRAQSLDELASAARLDASSCAVALTELELIGFVQRLSGGYIRRPSEF